MDDAPPTMLTHGIVGPNMLMQWDHKLTISHDDLASLKGQSKTIHLWGEVTYKDGFKNHRFTKFNFICRGNGSTVDWTMKAYKHGNEGN